MALAVGSRAAARVRPRAAARGGAPRHAGGAGRRELGLAAGAAALALAAPRRADAESKPFCDWTQTLPCELLHSGDGYTPMPGFETGALYRELRIGEGDAPSVGDKVCCDWAMYTFYLSHVVSARGLTKGGAFEGDDVDATFLRFTLGDGSMIGAVEGALLSGMRVGGVRRVIIFPGAASYPGMLPNDKGRNWSQLGPAPETLSGRRSLDFVAKNTANVDKSLLMDIELLGVGEGARAVRGPGAWTPEALAAAKTGSL